MDLLDNITSLMTKTEKERAGRPKKAAEVSCFDENGKASNNIVAVINPGKTSGASIATPSTSSTAPKVETMSSHPSSSAAGLPTKHRQEVGTDSKGGCDFLIHRRLPVEMNGVYMDLSRAPEFVRRYHIDVRKVVQGTLKDVTRGPKQDFSTQQRRRALFALFRQLVSDNLNHFGEDRCKHVYDLGNTFYSIGCKITEQNGEVVFKMKPSEIVSSSARAFLPRRCQQLLFTVQYAGQVRIKGLREDEEEGNVREACRFFEVLTSQCLYEGDSYNFANKFFESSVDKDVKIGEGKCVKSGFEKNVRMVSKDGELVAPVLQVKYKRSLRFPRLPLASERKAANMLNYYPLEPLVVEPAQRVSSKKLTGTLTGRMIQQARILPHELKKNNRRQLALARLAGVDNEYLHFDSLQPNGRGKLSWKLAERLPFYRQATVETLSIVILDIAVHRNQASVKCGGLNHMVSSTPVALGNRTYQRDMNGRLFSGKMFVAFELSHLAALNFYDRQNKKGKLQKNQRYIRDHFNVAFTRYFKEKKSLPAEVKEARDIRAVAEGMKDHNGAKTYSPRIIVIFVQSIRNYRITPASLVEERSDRFRAAELNVPSGTYVDTDIVNRHFREFIMRSQQSNIVGYFFLFAFFATFHVQ
uniref:PAZ domain-containing protein n=1 Tax=Angiostrongylus cantonensis TaxID=6313 RepID=A0A158PCU8_ANGCA